MILHETNKIAELKRKGYTETAELMEYALQAAREVREECAGANHADLVYWRATVVLSRYDRHFDILETTERSIRFSISMRFGSEPAIVEVDLQT